MHTLTVQTKFTFGDRVRVNSFTQRRKGTGTVEAIMLDRYGQTSYMIGFDGSEEDFQPGILESEMTMLEEAS
ncbi:MAG: hypothetical protein L0241_14605 [Planctomycetia bacterium]|nr:hypothetical protein [Planctomycetia bacterium]